MDVSDWLRNLGLSQYEAVFRKHQIDAALLSSLTAGDLKDLGVDLVGHRRRLLDAITALHNEVGLKKDPAGSSLEAMNLPAADGERRQVAVLFADLAGSTALSNELDPEEMHFLLDRYFECVDGVIESYGGHIDKHVGDSVMAVFGAPLAHSNDTERAVGAALAIRDAMTTLSARVHRPTRVHIGVAGGQVVASSTGSTSHREYTVTGDTVNLASRLTDAAPPGEILISDRVQRALAKRLECVDAGKLQVKGFAGGVQAWQLRSLRDAAPEHRLFVGRTGEMALFRSALATSRESGGGQAIYMRGEAGIGKTRLVEELQRAAIAAGFACHTGVVLDFGTGTGQDAIPALVRGLLGLDVASGDEVARAAAAAALDEGLVAADDAVFLNELLQLPQPTSLRPLFEAMDNATRNQGKRRALIRLLERASAVRPRLLIVEDVHWADRLTLTYLAELTITVTQLPALLVMTSRIDGDPIDWEWRARAEGIPLITVDLGPLPPEEARALAAVLADEVTAFTEQCVERAAGNPLFLEQLLRHAEESVTTRVPDSVQSLVQSRVDQLETSDKTALQAASILGQRFGRDQLSFLLARPDYVPDRLVSRNLIRPQGEVFLFAHALVRDAVYDTLLKSRRRDLHRRAAEWFAERNLVLRAEHLDRADDAGAVSAYLVAAQLQVADYRYELALRLVERGLELAVERADRFVLTCLQGDVLHDLGDMPAAGRAYNAALGAATADDERCRALIGLAAVKRVTEDLAGAFADLERAEMAAVASGAVAERARIHFLRGNLFFPRGDIDGCVREHMRSLELAREAGIVESEAAALGGLGDAEYVRGRMISAHDRLRACVELCEEHRFGRTAVANHAQIAHTLLYIGPQQAALEAGLQAAASAARVGHQRAEINARAAAYYALSQLVQPDECRAEILRTQKLISRLGARRFEPFCLLFLGRVALAEGKRSEAIELLREALDISRRTGITFQGPLILGALALCVEGTDERHRLLAEGQTIIDAGCVGHNHLWFYRDAMEVCLELREYEELERYAARFDDYTRAEPLRWSTYFIGRGRILAAAGRDRRDLASTDTLMRLREEGDRLGLKVTLPAIEAALAANC
jgi:class 3 adenylate cyclase/tetratricopeptide (TPR) repeat protein